MVPDRIRVLIVGNSHSKDTFNKLASEPDLFPEFEFGRFGMAISCMNTTEGQRLFSSENFLAADVVMISTRWDYPPCLNRPTDFTDFDGARMIARRVAETGKTLVLTSSSLEFPQFGNFTLADRIVLRHRTLERLLFWRKVEYISGDELHARVNRTYFERRHREPVSRMNADVARLAHELGAVFLDKEDTLCDRARRLCFGLADDYQKSFYDYGHYTPMGARHFGRRAAEIDWLAPVREAVTAN
ncbi:MAG: hypothetical protein LAT56_11835 [Wenzhouxiangella sp.]|nr:hypothetical protein [Wenzhouxiangella sp.]